MSPKSRLSICKFEIINTFYFKLTNCLCHGIIIFVFYLALNLFYAIWKLNSRKTIIPAILVDNTDGRRFSLRFIYVDFEMENEHVCQTFAYFHVDGIVEKKEISVFFSIQPPKIMLCRRHLKTKKGKANILLDHFHMKFIITQIILSNWSET